MRCSGTRSNITDSQMAVLGGRFTMMLIVDAPDGTDLDVVHEELARTQRAARARRGRAQPARRRGGGRAAAPPLAHRHRLRRRPPGDRARRLSARLAARAVNVTDLETRLVGDGLYAMVLEIALPPDLDPEALAAMLAEVGAEQGVEVTVRPLETDVM